jgi:predicted GNAT family acetyltransferase
MDVQDNAAAHRYEITVGEAVAFINYRDMQTGVRALVHTEVPPELNGQGVGSRLVKGALEDNRSHGRRIMPSCSFVRSYIERHPEYQDLVAG